MAQDEIREALDKAVKMVKKTAKKADKDTRAKADKALNSLSKSVNELYEKLGRTLAHNETLRRANMELSTINVNLREDLEKATNQLSALLNSVETQATAAKEAFEAQIAAPAKKATPAAAAKKVTKAAPAKKALNMPVKKTAAAKTTKKATPGA